MRAPRLAIIAAAINRYGHGWSAETSEGYCNTDRKIGRLRRAGKGRRGTVIRIFWRGQLRLTHNSAETYRCNAEVVAWVDREIIAKSGRKVRKGG